MKNKMIITHAIHTAITESKHNEVQKLLDWSQHTFATSARNNKLFNLSNIKSIHIDVANIDSSKATKVVDIKVISESGEVLSDKTRVDMGEYEKSYSELSIVDLCTYSIDYPFEDNSFLDELIRLQEGRLDADFSALYMPIGERRLDISTNDEYRVDTVSYTNKHNTLIRERVTKDTYTLKNEE